MNDWIEVHKGKCDAQGTEAMQIAGGCLVRTAVWQDTTSTESSVFVPDSSIENNQVVKRPTRIQVSKTQCITADEVAAISKRPDELIFTLRCGKEISVTENIDLVLATFMEFSP